MPAYDASNKLLFSHPEMVAGMLELGVGQQWVRQSDLSRLKPVAGGKVSDKLVKRRGDQVWRAERPEGPLYILIEFQSTPDQTMGVRFPTYGGLLAQRLMREEKGSEEPLLGPLFALLLYNGPRPWDAPREAAELFGPVSEELRPYQLGMRYFVIDMQRFSRGELRGRKNPFACLLRLEQSRSLGEVEEVVDDMLAWFAGPQHQLLRRDMATWLLEVLLPSRFPGLTVPDSVEDLMGFKSMLAERAKQWPQQWMEEGRKEGHMEGRMEGRREGRQAGLREGQARQLAHQLEQKFGALPEDLRLQLDSADTETLMEWAGKLLVADELGHIFNGHFTKQ